LVVYRCLLGIIEKDIVMTAIEKNTVMEIAIGTDRTLETVAGRMSRMKSMVTQRPLVTIAIAVGVGILLSFLWRRQAHGLT
jgi:ElaB/YqjD/DUF883 family membrane-anchored ribosome-binding protein